MNEEKTEEGTGKKARRGVDGWTEKEPWCQNSSKKGVSAPCVEFLRISLLHRRRASPGKTNMTPYFTTVFFF